VTRYSGRNSPTARISTRLIRANVMIVSDGKLRMFASANMDFHNDYGVTLDKNQGCAGFAWARAVELPLSQCWIPVYAPNAKLKKTSLKEIRGVRVRLADARPGSSFGNCLKAFAITRRLFYYTNSLNKVK
jgi:hypothetical protein